MFTMKKQKLTSEKKVYKVTLSERYCRTVLVEAVDAGAAEDIAFELYNQGKIQLDPKQDFDDGWVESDGEATSDDLDWYGEIYKNNDPV